MYVHIKGVVLVPRGGAEHPLHDALATGGPFSFDDRVGRGPMGPIASCAERDIDSS